MYIYIYSSHIIVYHNIYDHTMIYYGGLGGLSDDWFGHRR